MRIALLLVVLAAPAAFAQRGVPQNGFPSWQERTVLMLVNRTRAQPTADPKACAAETVRPPVVWNYNLNRAARFHSTHMQKSAQFMHNSPCVLSSNIATAFSPGTTCDGAVSCACSTGAVTCTRAMQDAGGCPAGSFTTWSSRVSMFGTSPSAENIAYGYGTPRIAHNGWMMSDGHCKNILNAHGQLGVGHFATNNYWTENFGSGGSLAGSLIAGSHEPQLTTTATLSVEFRANYYNTAGAPQAAQLNLDGVCSTMTRERGTDTNGTWLSTQSLTGTTCRRYAFTFKDPAGNVVHLPETGSYGVGGSGCADYSTTAPAACPVGGNQSPTIATMASATPSPVTASTTALSVLGADDGGEGALTYTWAATGPAAVTYSVNGTNAAKASTATFTRAGSYTFTVTVRDAAGATATSTVSVTVQQTPTAVSVAPATASVVTSATQAFTATLRDQFAQTITGAAFTWAVSGGGAISTGGVFTAGTTVGGPHTVTATSSGRSGTAQVTVTVPANTAPTIATAAAATPSPVTGTTTALSVLGADNGGEAALTYTWAATGPAAVTYSANGANAAKASTATFTRAGSYVFTVTVRDVQGLTATSTVSVTVQQRPTTVAVTPAMASVARSGTQAFAAAVSDQFAQPIASPAVTWSVSGGGTISAAGLFTAGTSSGGPFTVTATSGTATGTAQVTITNAAPTIATAAAATPSPVTGTTTALSVLGADDAGEAGLTYTWAATGPASVAVSPNGTNAAKAATATFTRVGAYSLTVTVRDAQGLTVTSAVSVTVQATATGVTVMPASVTLAPAGTQAFTAAVVDQFSQPMAGSPTWAVSGGGSISGAGVFTAGSTPGGPYTVTATLGSVSATAQVSVSAGMAPTVATAAAAMPSPVTGTTASLSVLGADDGGEGALTYTWAATGPASVSYSVNGTNAAKGTTATFTAAGTYVFTVTVRDAQGLTVTSTVTVTVAATPATLVVAPAMVSVVPTGTQAFSATVSDQFAAPLASQPSVTWSVGGGGAISTGGVFTAGATAGGPFTVTATAGSVSGTAAVTVSAGVAPTLVTAASATPNPVTGTTTQLAALGADDQGEAGLTYTWAATGPAAVTYSANGTNAAKSATATFTRAGTYLVTVTVRDAGGLTVTSQVTVTVEATLTTLALAPASVTVMPGQPATFTASTADQFGDAMTATVQWTVSGGGTIDAMGIFTAGAVAGGPHTVTATAGGQSATAQVTVSDVTPPLLTVQLTQPAASAQVSGVVTLLATTSDDARVANVVFLVDGVALATDSAAPWRTDWNTALVSEGVHQLSARATEGTGGTVTSAEVAVTVVRAPTGDTTPPVVRLDSPVGTVTGAALLRATATDDVGVVELVFELDGAEVVRLAKAPWAYDVPAAALTAGDHQVRVTARDAAGNVGADMGGFTVLEATVTPLPIDPEEPVLGGCGCASVDLLALGALATLLLRRRRRS